MDWQEVRRAEGSNITPEPQPSKGGLFVGSFWGMLASVVIWALLMWVIVG